jgi:hypothetical protein
MEMMVNPAAWRCDCYLVSGVDSTKRRILFFNRIQAIRFLDPAHLFFN